MTIAFATLTDDSNSLAVLSRYEARFRRNYERALCLLRALRDPSVAYNGRFLWGSPK